MSANAGTASAATYQYCSGCTIYANGYVKSGVAAYLTLDYVHRLSGPGSGVTIAAVAQYADNGAWGTFVYSSSTEVQHGYNGGRRAWGIAVNYGSGNYGFNAHENY